MLETDTARDIRFLESVENLKRVVEAATGRNINTEVALQVSACLQQGRLFFEAASASAHEIRPLLLSYGTIALVKAVVVARAWTKLEALPQAHGIKDISSPTAMMKDLRVKIAIDGVFQRAVDVAHSIERLSLLDGTRTIWFPTPGCQAIALANLELSLQDILGRVGDLATLYRQTFLHAPMVISTSVMQRMNADDIYDLRVDIPAATVPSAGDLISTLSDLKQRYPFLLKLNFSAASFAWDHIAIIFDNCRPGGQFPESGSDIQAMGQGTELLPVQRLSSEKNGVPLSEILPCSEGGLHRQFPTFSSPVRDEVYLSEIVLHYLGTYLLGSLVRYRPQTWIHALYGTETPNRPRDDAIRALIESFLDVASRRVPRWCALAICAPDLSNDH